MATTEALLTSGFVVRCTAMALDKLRLPSHHVAVDYDPEADVLYMSFRKPQNATRTIELDEDILVRKDGRTIVGLTIMNASTKSGHAKSHAAARRQTERDRN